jgi:hypothetical protein
MVCVRCGRTLDHVVKKDAEVELEVLAQLLSRYLTRFLVSRLTGRVTAVTSWQLGDPTTGVRAWSCALVIGL